MRWTRGAGEASARQIVSEPMATAATAAFFLDFDGTLVEIAPTPEAVVTPPGLAELLADLARRTGGAVAVLSGRSAAAIDRLLAPTALPGCGQHGLELRLPGGVSVCRDVAEMEPVRRRLAAVSIDWPAGVAIEDKGLSIAVHYRAAPEAAERVEGAVARAVEQAPGTFRLRRGKMVVEASLAGASKGTALRRLMIEPPFLGRIPVVLGDDVTDDDAFDAARAFGGTSFQVGPRAGHRADFEIEGPAGVLGLLKDFAEAPEGAGRMPA